MLLEPVPMHIMHRNVSLNYSYEYTVPEFSIHGSMHHKNILVNIQQDATLHSLFYLEVALHVSGATTTHHQERKQLVFVTPLLLPAAVVEELERV
jgi:hypothetical protein